MKVLKNSKKCRCVGPRISRSRAILGHPLFSVFGDFLRRRDMFVFFVGRLFNLSLSLNEGVEFNKFLERLGNSLILVDCLPRTSRLTCCTVDTLRWIDQELIRWDLRITTLIKMNTINRTDTNTSGVQFVNAQRPNYPSPSNLLGHVAQSRFVSCEMAETGF